MRGGVLIDSAGPVTLIGGGPVASGQLAEALALAPVVVGADGGGDVALPRGVEFAAVIGDMDSLRGAGDLRARGVALHDLAEQDSTDLEKCLYSVRAPLFLGLGFLGGRFDHSLAAMNALARNPERKVALIGRVDVCFLCPPRFEIDLEPGTRVSLFPMARVQGLRSEGLRWSVAGLDFAPDARSGTSNKAEGGWLRLAFDRPGMVMILPAALMARAVARLGAAPVWDQALAGAESIAP